MSKKLLDSIVKLPYDYISYDTLPNSFDVLYFGTLALSSKVSLYESCTEKEYVPYVRPQEHGNHYGTKMLKIGNMQIESKKGFEFNVSDYSTEALYRAEHTDELKKDGFVHLRVDYKVSGIGSNSCGPVLDEKYRLKEKEFDFNFSIDIN